LRHFSTMQKIIVFLVAAIIVLSCSTGKKGTAQFTEHVWGNCEKCKANIENACKIQGVSEADWSVDSKLLTLKLDTSIVSVESVLKSVAKAGYDSEKFFADDYSYGALPQCCQYERRKAE
jgi:periplasmic mercuric ion binding protein